MRAEVEVLGDLIRVAFPEDLVVVSCDRWQDRHGTVSAEALVVTSAPGVPPHIHQARMTLTNTRLRREFANHCAARFKGPDWQELIEIVTVRCLAVRRVGVTPHDLARFDPGTARQYRLDRLIPESGVTVFYGDGGVGKSTAALMIACAIETGGTFAGHEAERGHVLYADYETSAHQQARRLRQIARGMELMKLPEIHYKQLVAPLPDVIPELRQTCDELAVDAMILDSLGYAGGGQNDAEPTLAVFRALNSLRRPVLALAHISKHADATKPYGSVFVWNAARSVVEVKKYQQEDATSLTLGFFHRKSNDDRLDRPFGLEIRFSPEATVAKTADIRDVPGLAESVPVADRVVRVLQRGALKVQDIADELGKSEAVIRVTLKRMKEREQVIKLSDGTWGLLGKGA